MSDLTPNIKKNSRIEIFGFTNLVSMFDNDFSVGTLLLVITRQDLTRDFQAIVNKLSSPFLGYRLIETNEAVYLPEIMAAWNWMKTRYKSKNLEIGKHWASGMYFIKLIYKLAFYSEEGLIMNWTPLIHARFFKKQIEAERVVAALCS